MVRTYKRQLSPPQANKEDIDRAVKGVLEGKMTLRKAAVLYGVSHSL